ncbi:hypothetical protein LUZ60_001742 [Juncus effusus]|nr:hypothetical protein LUZ60_001742 [Juncus effusus]
MNEYLPGYRFYPTEEELVGFYLQNKLQNKREEEMQRFIPVMQFYSMDPWQLPNLARVPMINNDEQWFFFCPRQERETLGGRPSRTTPSGYWKATGSPSVVFSSENGAHLGEKRSMVFYQGRAPTGTKTVWKLNEYRAFDQEDRSMVRSEFSLCRLYNNSSGLRQFDRRPCINTMINENQNLSNQNQTSEIGPSSSKRQRSKSSSSSDGGDLVRPMNQHNDLRVDDYESDWDFLDLI